MRSYVARSGVKEYETTLPLKEGQLRDRTPIRGGDAYLVFDDLDWDWSLVTPLNVSYENEYGKTAVSAAEIFEQEGQNKVIRSLIPAAITETLSPLTASLSVTVNGKTTLLQTTISMNGIDAINDLTIGDLRAGKATVYGDIYDQKNGERNISQIITNLQSGTLVVSVKETEIKYGRNNSATVAPETGWFDNPPAATEGEYLWTRTKWIYSNGTSKSSYSVVKDGKSSYLHTAWANSSDGTVDFSTTSSVGRSYIGTYSDSNEAGSSTPSEYKWVKTTGTAIVGVASKNLWEPDRLITNLTNRGLRFQIDNPVRIHSLKVYSTESGYIDLVIKKSDGTAVFNSSYQVEKGEQTLTLELQLTDVGEYTITKTDSLSLSYHTTMESEFPFNSGTFKITASTGDSYTKTRYYYFYDWVVSGEGVIAKTPDLWFIGADGYWYLNGVKTAKPSQGTDGKDGTDGEDAVTKSTYLRYSKNANGTPMLSQPTAETQYLGQMVDLDRDEVESKINNDIVVESKDLVCLASFADTGMYLTEDKVEGEYYVVSYNARVTDDLGNANPAIRAYWVGSSEGTSYGEITPIDGEWRRYSNLMPALGDHKRLNFHTGKGTTSNKCNAEVTNITIRKVQPTGENLAANESVVTFSKVEYISQGKYKITSSGGMTSLQISRYAVEHIPYAMGQEYVLSFDIQKLSGTIYCIAGSIENYTQTSLTIDGINYSTSFQNNTGLIPYPDDTAIHHVELGMKLYRSQSSSFDIYIQPNRRDYREPYEAIISNLSLVKGDHKPFAEAPADTLMELEKRIDDPGNYAWSLIKGSDGQRGPIGPTGTSISSVVEWYLATNLSSGVTTDTDGWKTTLQTMTPTKKYLWNYEVINFSDGSSSPTIPVIIGVYGDTGKTGATGRSIIGITEHYLASSLATGVTRTTSGWKTTMQTTTPTNKYLWNYETITWSSGTTTTYTDPIIIGIHGDKGKQGLTGTGISSVIVEYAISGTTEPTSWTTTPPDTWGDNEYLWTRYKITYTDDEIKYTGANRLSDIEAQKVLAKAQELIDGIQVGGRNLLLSSNTTELSEIETGNDDSDIEVMGDEWGRNLLPKSLFAPWQGGYIENNNVYTLQGLGLRAGIRLPYNLINPDTDYILRFKTKKLSGDVTTMGGHIPSANYLIDEICRDGMTLQILPKWVVDHPNDLLDHEYLWKLKSKEAINDWIYIQPNRPDYDSEYSMEIWDIKMELGTTPTPWTPAPEDLTHGYRYTLSQPIQPDTWYTLSTDYTGDWQGLWIDNEYVGYLSDGKITFRSSEEIAVESIIIKVDGEVPLIWAKLEKGNKATDWTPAPEDIDDQIVNTREVIEAKLDETDRTILAIANDQTISPLEEADLRNLITQMEVDTSILIAKNNGVNDTSSLTTAGDNLKTFILDALSAGSYAEINSAEFNDLYQTYKNEEATLENLIKDTEQERYTDLEAGQITLGTRIGSYEEQLKLESGLIAMYIDRGYGLEQAMTLAKDELAFYLDKQRKAWIGLNGLNADNATIGQSARIGNHEFQKFGTDYTTINWVGE